MSKIDDWKVVCKELGTLSFTLTHGVEPERKGKKYGCRGDRNVNICHSLVIWTRDLNFYAWLLANLHTAFSICFWKKKKKKEERKIKKVNANFGDLFEILVNAASMAKASILGPSVQTFLEICTPDPTENGVSDVFEDFV